MYFTYIDTSLSSSENLQLDEETAEVIEMMELLRRGNLTSTSALLIKDYNGGQLFKVKSSRSFDESNQSRIGEQWKKFIIDLSIQFGGTISASSDCYEHTPYKDQSKYGNHAQFSYGCLVTTNIDGSYERRIDETASYTDIVCYVIPVCEFHNRPKIEYVFDTLHKNVIQLSGLGSMNVFPVTFIARLKVKEPTYVCVFKTDNGWDILKFNDAESLKEQVNKLINLGKHYVVFKKEP